MRRARALAVACCLLISALAAIAIVLLRPGLVPWRNIPLPAIDLAVARPWLVDRRLAALGRDAGLCRRVLQPPHIVAEPIADQAPAAGCGWTNAVRLASAGGARIALDRLSCEAAAAVALWIEHEVQPLAEAAFGARVTRIEHRGGYACRDIVGNPRWRGIRSEHASANAVDIAGFVLADGRQIDVRRHWSGGGAEAEFLRRVHAGACRYFRVTLGPDYNAAHHDHFHLDRGPDRQCR